MCEMVCSWFSQFEGQLTFNLAIRDVVGSRLSGLEAQFTGYISDIAGFWYSQFRSQFTVAISE